MANSFKEYLEGSSLFTFDTTTGQIIPDTTKVLDGVKNVMVNIFDQNLDVSDETPAGRIAETIALAIKRFASTTASFANQINPYYATGQMLDAVGSLFAIKRTGATASTINVTIAGTPGTVVPSGSIISDNRGNQFEIKDFGIGNAIPAGGTISATAVCTETGPISVDNGTVTNIVSSVVGWSSVTNTGMSYIGETIESDEHFRNRILLARWTGTAFTESIRSSIEKCDGVDSVVVVENGEGSDVYLNDSLQIVSTIPSSGKYIKIVSHSVCIIVYGKTMTEELKSLIASAIYSTKSAGCGYTKLDSATQGSTKGNPQTKSAIDSINGVAYPIVFNTPITVPFGVNITVNKGTFLGTATELQELVKNAIKAWAAGETPFVDGLKLGQSLYAFEIGAAVSDVIPSIQIANVALSVDSTTAYSRDIFVYEIGELNPAEINVTVN